MSAPMMVTADERFAICDLFAEYAACLDEFRLSDWLDLFVEDCLYRIVPRENYAANLPLSLVLCDSKDMLRDRVVALQEANEYNIHIDRHVVSSIRFRARAADQVQVEASYAVYQINTEGEVSLFAVGVYLDEVVFVGGQPRFKSKTVVMDNSCVPHAISTPL